MKTLILLGIFLNSASLLAKDSFSKATFAGGCFWCMEPPYEKLVGVSSVISGFAGGTKKNPSYELVSSGKTKHREAVQITFDPSIISYERLLEIFWQNIDPTDSNGQFVDKGFQYTSAIFTHDEEQTKLAKKSLSLLRNLKLFKKPIVTPIIEFSTFYPAEEYHQDFYRKSLITKAKYKYYRNASGRDDFINKYWSEGNKTFLTLDQRKVVPPKETLEKKLSETQFDVTQEDGTEPPFKNKYWDNKKEGIYVDIVSGEPLFSSKDKYQSGTGWPSFTKPVRPFHIIQKVDSSLIGERIEIRSRIANSHLGHVFKDGPDPTGLRFCMNSAALKFIPKEELKENGLSEFEKDFN